MPESQTSLPRALAAVAEVLPQVSAPTGGFDAAGIWHHRYRIVVIEPQPGPVLRFVLRPGGWLALSRRPLDGEVELVVEQSAAVNGGPVHTRATVVCAADELATPRRWTSETQIFDPQGGKRPLGRAAHTGRAEAGRIVRQDEGRPGAAPRPIERPAPARLAADWGLFDALQRLGGEVPEPFELFEELELLKPEQRLVAREPVVAELGGQAVRLRGLDHLGRGVLPRTWWLDDAGRVVAAVGNHRAWLWDPQAGSVGDAQ